MCCQLLNLFICFFLWPYISLKISTPDDGEILIDYSKNRVDDHLLKLLLDLVSCKYNLNKDEPFNVP